MFLFRSCTRLQKLLDGMADAIIEAIMKILVVITLNNIEIITDFKN